MKINIISDIHADFNAETGKIVYNLPLQHSKKTYMKAFSVLHDFWKNSFDECKKHAFNDFCSSVFLNKNSNASNALEELCSLAKNNFSRFTYEKMHQLVAVLRKFSCFCFSNNLDWQSKKTKLQTYDMTMFLEKQMCDFDPSKLEAADYLIIAGDLGLDNFYDDVLNDIAKKTKGKFKKILHIAGNHDHWWKKTLDGASQKPSCINLKHDFCEHVDGEYAFVGCTLWTPVPENAIKRTQYSMNDYRFIPGNFTPENSTELHKIQAAWLKNKLIEHKDKKVVVFTHHQPFNELIAKDYKHNGRSLSLNVSEAYAVLDHSLDNINEHGNIVLWCCGHTHECFDKLLHNVRVVRNPIGYRDHYGYLPAENMSGKWYNNIIEV